MKIGPAEGLRSCGVGVDVFVAKSYQFVRVRFLTACFVFRSGIISHEA